jgi:hypothetical protein
MKLAKFAALVCVALLVVAQVSNSGALASLSGAASRSVSTENGSCYSSGVLYPVYLDVADGKWKRAPMTSLAVNYRAGSGTIIAQNTTGVFQADFSAADVTKLTNTDGPNHNEHWFTAGFGNGATPAIAGTFVNAANESIAAVGFIKIGWSANSTWSYWDFSYNATTGTATAVTATRTGGNLVSLIVRDAVTGAYLIGNGTTSNCPPQSYSFFNESADVDWQAGTVLATYGGVIDIRP